MFWLSDQSSILDGGITLLLAVALLLVAIGATLARRELARMTARMPQEESSERGI